MRNGVVTYENHYVFAATGEELVSEGRLRFRSRPSSRSRSRTPASPSSRVYGDWDRRPARPTTRADRGRHAIDRAHRSRTTAAAPVDAGCGLIAAPDPQVHGGRPILSEEVCARRADGSLIRPRSVVVRWASGAQCPRCLGERRTRGAAVAHSRRPGPVVARPRARRARSAVVAPCARSDARPGDHLVRAAADRQARARRWSLCSCGRTSRSGAGWCADARSPPSSCWPPSASPCARSSASRAAARSPTSCSPSRPRSCSRRCSRARSLIGRPVIARVASDFCQLAPEVACRPRDRAAVPRPHVVLGRRAHRDRGNDVRDAREHAARRPTSRSRP